MIIKYIEVDKFRAMKKVKLNIGNNLTVIAGRNATMKSTLLGMLGQPFSITEGNPLYGERTIDGYNFRSQFKDKFRLSDIHDIAGEHKWKLKLMNDSFYHNDYIEIISVNRKAKGKKDTIRFINSEGKIKGKGYIQLPVVYLGLSRLFPIGEIGKTTEVSVDLSDEENDIIVSWYREVLSISGANNSLVDIQKKDAKHIFAGVSDDYHDVFTSSAGEGNLGRIFISLLSFKRLKDKYSEVYKGGILLIDELDATLYGYSQIKLVRLLSKLSKEYRIQIIFTTHSPIILREINKLQRNELKDKRIDINNNFYHYDNEIINLFPEYESNIKFINGTNCHTSRELTSVINDINLTPTTITQSVNVYLEDDRAISLFVFLLSKANIDISQYLNVVDVNLGWTNYIQLYNKGIPEFNNSLIVLDCDVLEKKEYKNKQKIVEKSDNILFLPIDVERGMFELLKSHDIYNEFQNKMQKKNINISYDVCFRDWPNEKYENTLVYKEWFGYIESIIKDVSSLFEIWYSMNTEKANAFVLDFVAKYNILAEKQELDYLISSVN